MIEPIILVVMAVVIWFIAVGIFQPIMNLAGTMGG
jgi:type II secretory pathway component PulF